MKKLVTFMMLLAGLLSFSLVTFEQPKTDDFETQNLAKESDKEVRRGTEGEGIFLI